ncbi:MAG: DUF1761 domain-containing protein [Candidatus Saccharimonadales bacterium]
MDVSVNYLAVLLAALSTMAVGSVWYSPAGFYKQWAKLAKVKENKNITGKQMAVMYGSVLIASTIMAYVLAHVAFLSNQYFQNAFWQDAVTTAFWLWLGFVATRFYVHDTFENRAGKLTVLNSGYELATLLVMGLIIGFMGY